MRLCNPSKRVMVSEVLMVREYNSYRKKIFEECSLEASETAITQKT